MLIRLGAIHRVIGRCRRRGSIGVILLMVGSAAGRTVPGQPPEQQPSTAPQPQAPAQPPAATPNPPEGPLDRGQPPTSVPEELDDAAAAHTGSLTIPDAE